MPSLNSIADTGDISTRIVDADTLASLLKALADPLRLSILRVLSHDSFGVLELCTVFDIKQSALSHHLKVLLQSGLVTRRRDGNSIFYRRATSIEPAHLSHLQHAAIQSIDALLLSTKLEKGMGQVQQERSENSRRFFAHNANKFKAQQDLIAGLNHYGSAVTEMIDLLYPEKAACALELGPGTGDYLSVLSQRFNQVIALDSSADMLASSAKKVAIEQLSNVQFIQGDTTTALSKHILVDCIVVNMVLHHTPNPAIIFQDLRQCLKPGGHLIICDLCSHDQSWARENCGDIWLGFDEQELSLWAQQAGLNQGQASYLTLRNGFRIQIRHFHHPSTIST